MKSNRISIAFVGDMSFGDSLFCQGFGVRSVARQNDDDFLFAEVRNILKKNDIVFGNLETVLSRQGEDLRSLISVNMRGDPECVHALKVAGFTVLNLANNHTMQHGLLPFWETVDLLRSSDIQCIGLKADSPWHSQPVIVHKNDVKVGFIGYAFETDKYYTGKLPYAFGMEDLIAKDIETLRPRVEILIVSNHWGLERMDRPSVATIRLARRMIDMGANIVIGHHPHVLQGVECYKKGIIAYSLGNFVFDMGGWNRRYRESMIFKITCGPGQELTYEIIPVITGSDCQPFLAHEKERDELLTHMDNLSKKVKLEMKGTVEENSLKYYKEYIMLTKRNRMNAYRYFISNLSRYKKRFVWQQLAMTFRNRLEDLGFFISGGVS